MDRFKTFTGSLPIYLGDIDFMQDAVKNAFSQLLRGLTGQETPNCIIVPSSSSKDGVICIEGEIMPLKYGIVNARTYYQALATRSGRRTTKAGLTIACYESRYAVCATGNGDEATNAKNFPNLSDLLIRNIPSQSGHSEITTGSIQTIMKVVQDGLVTNINGSLQVLEDAFTTDIIVNKPTSIPEGTWMLTIAYESYSKLKITPAKLVVVYDETEGVNKCTLTTNEMAFKKGDIGSFSLVIT